MWLQAIEKLTKCLRLRHSHVIFEEVGRMHQKVDVDLEEVFALKQ